MTFTREKAVSPLVWVKNSKYFTPVPKIDDTYGDRNLCTCLPIEEYIDPVIEFEEKEL